MPVFFSITFNLSQQDQNHHIWGLLTAVAIWNMLYSAFLLWYIMRRVGVCIIEAIFPDFLMFPQRDSPRVEHVPKLKRFVKLVKTYSVLT